MDLIKQQRYLIAVLILLSTSSIDTIAQDVKATKPQLMLIPSDTYCERNGFVKTYTDENGEKHQAPDYEKAVKNEEFRSIMAKFSEMMNKRGFPLTSLEATLKDIKQSNLENSFIKSQSGKEIQESDLDLIKRTAKPDIVLDLDFSCKPYGPKKFVSYNLHGLDAYSQKEIAAVTGDGKPAMNTPGTLLEEAVIGHIDNFNTQLQAHFTEMFTKGREIKIVIKVWEDSPIKLNSNVAFNGHTVRLSDWITRGWLTKKCIGGSFRTANASSTELRLEQVRIPLVVKDEIFGGERAINAQDIITDLSNQMKNKYNIESGIYFRGLGEAHLIIGEKEN